MKFISASCIAIIAVLFSLSFHSCSKSTTTSAQADSAFVKATIQGQPFTATGATGAYSGQVTAGGITTLTIYGVSSSGQAVQLELFNNTGGGTIQFGTQNASAYYYSGGGLQGSSTYATSGSITINALTPNLKGSFSFKTADNSTIAQGTFSVPAP